MGRNRQELGIGKHLFGLFFFFFFSFPFCYIFLLTLHLHTTAGKHGNQISKFRPDGFHHYLIHLLSHGTRGGCGVLVISSVCVFYDGVVFLTGFP